MNLVDIKNSHSDINFEHCLNIEYQSSGYSIFNINIEYRIECLFWPSYD